MGRKTKKLCKVTSIFVGALVLALSQSAFVTHAEELPVPTKEYCIDDWELNGSGWVVSTPVLIMPGEGFYIVPDPGVYKGTTDAIGRTPYRIYADRDRLLVDETTTIVQPGLRSTFALTDLEPYDFSEGNVWLLAQDILDPAFVESYKELGENLGGSFQKTEITGYVNNSQVPIVINQKRSTNCLENYSGETGNAIISLSKYGVQVQTILCYEPSYQISYEDLTEEEKQGLPDHYDIKYEEQTITLPNFVRPGKHFLRWEGGLEGFTDPEQIDGNTVYTFDWNNNLKDTIGAYGKYKVGDFTMKPVYGNGQTVTFHPNGGTIEGKQTVTYEINKTGEETVFDISQYVPVREGYTFIGWCTKPSAYYDSLVTDTGSYAWTGNQWDVHLYAKWAEETDEELEINGYRLDSENGKLTIITQAGVDNWIKYYSETDTQARSKVKAVEVTGDVTKVSAWAFDGCDLLETVSLSDKITCIDSKAFRACKSLKEIELPNSVSEIGSGCFDGCSALKTVVLPKELKYDIGREAFRNCSSLENITLPTTIKNITYELFSGCSGLQRITIPDGVTAIGANAFNSCTALESVTLPDSIEKIEKNAFDGCSDKLRIHVPASVIDKFRQDYLPDYADKIDCTTEEIKLEIVKATPSEDGKITSICANCGYVIEVKVIYKPKTVSLAAGDIVYNGEKKKPKVTVKDSSGKTIASTEYTVSYQNNINAGSATAIVKFRESSQSYEGSLTSTFRILKAENQITGRTSYEKTAKPQSQSFELNMRDKSGKLTYTSDNSKVTVSKSGKVVIAKNFSGKATITVKGGNENYKTVSKKVSIVVLPEKVSIESVTGKNDRITVKWDKLSYVSGYQICYARDEKFSQGDKNIDVTNPDTGKKTISDLKKGKVYYVRIRAYKKIGSKKIYGAWSRTKKVSL